MRIFPPLFFQLIFEFWNGEWYEQRVSLAGIKRRSTGKMKEVNFVFSMPVASTSVASPGSRSIGMKKSQQKNQGMLGLGTQEIPMTKPKPVNTPVHVIRPKRGKPFRWPNKVTERYYVYWANDVSKADPNHHMRDELLLVTETGIIVNDPDVGLTPKLGLSWIRVTPHVVIEEPFLANPGGTEVGLLGSLGITAGWLNHASNDQETLDDADLTEWQEAYLPAYGELMDNPEASFSFRLKVLQGWAARANWQEPNVWEVAATALIDFKGNPLRRKLESIFKRSVKDVRGAWQKICRFTKGSNSPSLYLGPKTDKFRVVDVSAIQIPSVELKAKTRETPVSYKSLTRVFPIRILRSKRVKEFCWPATRSESFYVVDPKTRVYLLVSPSYIQLFYPGYPVEPCDGCHFFRLTDHVVLEMPAKIRHASAYHKIINGLGITIAKVPVNLPYKETRKNSEVPNYFEDWAKSVMEEVPFMELFDTRDFDILRLNLVGSWVSKATLGQMEMRNVLTALAQDLGSSRSWKDVVDRVGDSLSRKGLTLRELRKLCAKTERKVPTYGLGSAHLPPKEADKIVKRFNRWRRAATIGRDRLDYPQWTICWSKQITELQTLIAGLPDKKDIK